MISCWKFFVLLASFVFCSGMVQNGSVDRIIAVVNEDIILYSELQESLKAVEKLAPDVKTDDPERKARLEQEILKQMIREKLTEQEVKRLKVTVTKREVDEAVEGIKRDHNFTDTQLEYVMKESGKTIEQFREGVRKELERNRMLERVLKSKVVITDQQVDAFMKGGPAGGSPSTEKVRLGIIFLPVAMDGNDSGEVEKKAADIRDRLREGVDFGRLAKQYSRGPAAESGGDIGLVAVEDLAPNVQKVVRALKKNEYSDPIKGQGGYYIFKAFDIEKQKLSMSDADARERARRQLFQQELNRVYEEWVQDLEARSYIKITL